MREADSHAMTLGRHRATLLEQPPTVGLDHAAVPSTEASDRVRDQALEVARGWSGDGAPDTWRLTAALFKALAHDEHFAVPRPATAISG